MSRLPPSRWCRDHASVERYAPTAGCASSTGLTVDTGAGLTARPVMSRGAVGKASRPSGDVALVPLLLGEGRSPGVGLRGVEATLRELDEDEVCADHADEDEEEADG